MRRTSLQGSRGCFRYHLAQSTCFRQPRQVLSDVAPMQRDSMLSELDIFVHFVAEGTLAAAARRLGLPTSTVSRAVQRLERSMRVSLVHRSAKAAVLTEAGRMLFAQAAAHVEGLRAIQAAFGDGEAPLRGVLRLTAPVDLGEAFVGELLARFTS